jgi:site-specific recombinase XerC
MMEKMEILIKLISSCVVTYLMKVGKTKMMIIIKTTKKQTLKLTKRTVNVIQKWIDMKKNITSDLKISHNPC